MAVGIDDVRLDDARAFADGIPHAAFAALRRDAPVRWHADAGFWSLTRHSDVAAVGRDTEHFSSEEGIMMFDQPELADPAAPRMMIEMDPPRHTRYRLLVNRGFTPRMVAQLSERVRAGAAVVVNEAASLGSCDFVSSIASPLPLQVIADLLGIPDGDRARLFSLSNRIMGHEDEEFGAATGPPYEAINEMFGYAAALAADRRATAGERSDDIVGALLSRVGDDQLTEEDFGWFFLLLIVAGNETTRTALSQGMLAFFEHPDQWDRLLAAPSLLDSAVEEVLRWSTPILHFRRTATADVEFNGHAIAKGQKVLLWYASANFDEEVFASPLTFDVGRSPNEHVTFGAGGPHFCLGAHLARLEIRAMLHELTTRLPGLHLDGPVERLASNWTNGIKRMRVAS
ncbi:MAG TPA: cytochrome P450 [Acidimicrobiales bacterium]|nr:cytochrome P450 [Acidimicrobiales bacterium]